jgi:tetratricopeptide (TPR) repeat protein
MKTIKIIILAALCIGFRPITATAQDLNKAFVSSYEAEVLGNYTKAIQALAAAKSNTYEVNLRMGWLQYLNGAFAESAASYLAATKQLPYSIEAKFGYVQPVAAVGNWDEVKKTYEEILKIDPQNTTAGYRLGLIHYNQNNFAKAEKYLKNVVNLYPFDYDSVVLLAWTNLKLGNNSDAKVLFQKALLIRPNDASATEGLQGIK